MLTSLKPAITAFLNVVRQHQQCGWRCKLFISGLLAALASWQYPLN